MPEEPKSMEAKVTYTITFGPRNRIKGVEPSKRVVATAAEALRSVEDLERSDEKATVQDASGRTIERWELRELAAGERR